MVNRRTAAFSNPDSCSAFSNVAVVRRCLAEVRARAASRFAARGGRRRSRRPLPAFCRRQNAGVRAVWIERISAPLNAFPFLPSVSMVNRRTAAFSNPDSCSAFSNAAVVRRCLAEVRARAASRFAARGGRRRSRRLLPAFCLRQNAGVRAVSATKKRAP